MANLYETKAIATDGLVACENPAPDAFMVTIKGLPAPATLKRGTVLARSGGTGGNGKMVVLGTAAGNNETLTANCVLCDDTEVGTTDVKALAYRTGHFSAEKLTVAASYTMSAADKEALRDAGILVSNAVEQ